MAFHKNRVIHAAVVCTLTFIAGAACAGASAGKSERIHAAADARTAAKARSEAGRGVPATIAGDGRPALRVHVLRVTAPAGGGDAILIADSSVAPARHVLIDAGNGAAAAAALEDLRVESIDLMILTHAHHDHYGGMDNVLDAVPVLTFAFTGQVRTAVTYRRLLERIVDEVPRVLVVDSVRRVRLGPAPDATTLVLLPPLSRYIDGTDDSEWLNEGSLAVRVERGTFSFLTTGDAEDDANRRFAARFPELVDVDVLKLGHHGSSDATQPFWLAATTPDAAIVSANGTTHPHGVVLRMVRERGIALYCTPQHGRVSIRVYDEGEYSIRTDKPADARCRVGSSAY